MKKIKRVWFVSHYSMPPQYEMRMKTQMYAHYLMQQGIDCTIFAASTIHNTDINLIDDDSKYIERSYGDLNFVHIKCSNYSGNGLSRIRNMQQFANGFKKIASSFPLPDAVVADANCTNYGPIWKFCHKHGIRFFVDVRDLWPLSIVVYLNMKESNPVIKYLYRQERKMYNRADGVIFSMEGGPQYIKDKGWTEIDSKKLHHINNGVKLDEFKDLAVNNIIDDPDLKNPDTFKFVYTGSIRKANNMEPVVHALEKFKDKDELSFLIYGEGNEKQSLEAYCSAHGMKNVKFKGQVDKKYIPYILTKCDMSIICSVKSRLLEYGGSQNKIFDYLAAGCPIMAIGESKYNLVKQYGCGLCIDEVSVDAIEAGIDRIISMDSDEIADLKKNAENLSHKFDYRQLTAELLEILES